jgi:hypothetical protein
MSEDKTSRQRARDVAETLREEADHAYEAGDRDVAAAFKRARQMVEADSVDIYRTEPGDEDESVDEPTADEAQPVVYDDDAEPFAPEPPAAPEEPGDDEGK